MNVFSTVHTLTVPTADLYNLFSNNNYKLHKYCHAKNRYTNLIPSHTGVVYVKFNKTSSAARALEEMHGKVMGSANRTIKVLVAAK